MSKALRTSSAARHHHQDRRSQIRTMVHCSALIRINPTITFPAHLRDLSVASAQVICDSRYALMIDPSGTGQMLAEAKPLELAVALPFDSKTDEFKTRGRVKYCSPLLENNHHNRMLLGLRFLSNDIAMLQKLDAIIEYLTNN